MLAGSSARMLRERLQTQGGALLTGAADAPLGGFREVINGPCSPAPRWLVTKLVTVRSEL
jgi:hypothetical protein